MDPVIAPPVERRVVSRTVPIEAVRPEWLLRSSSKGPRGFWARGASWVAHVGAAALARIDGGGSGAGPFEAIWQTATTHTMRGNGDRDAGVRPPRFYGGFAFRADHRANGMWSGFPAALFVLPELEVTGGPRGYRLTANALTGPSQDPDEVEAALRARLEDGLACLRNEAATATEDRGRPMGRVPAGATTSGDREAWDRVVSDALDAIRSGQVSKVVLARTLDVTPPQVLDPVDVVRALWSDNPQAHVFLFEPEPGAVLVGAAPETVATVSGRDFHATAVAGSVPHGETPEETSALAVQLLSSEKDLLEHRFAVEDMVARLEDIALEVSSEWEPHVITLTRIQHLETRIRARLPTGCTVLDALEALHPTPAVCGLPRDDALAFIHEEEPFDRGWYAGPVGWFDTDGSGVFAPALRTAVCQTGTWRLFAGAGIVAGSQPALEWEETGIKFEPVLRALAASGPA